jgi:hypothetical protein
MSRRLILGLAAGAALVATVLAFVAGNMPLALVFLLCFLLWSVQMVRPKL